MFHGQRKYCSIKYYLGHLAFFCVERYINSEKLQLTFVSLLREYLILAYYLTIEITYKEIVQKANKYISSWYLQIYNLKPSTWVYFVTAELYTTSSVLMLL